MNPLENLLRVALGSRGPAQNNVNPPDLDNPKWQSADEQGLLDEAGNMTFGAQRHGNPGLRTTSGLLDLLHGIGHEFASELEALEAEGAIATLPAGLAQVLAPSPAPIYVQADTLPARYFHTETLTLPIAGEWTLISARTDRMLIEITNQGANPMQISWTDDDVLIAGDEPLITIPNGLLPGNPRRIAAGGKIYGYSVLGTTFDYIETYGFRNQKLDWANP